MISTMSKSNLLYFIKKVNQEVDSRLNLKFQRVQMRAQINIYKILSLIYPLNHLPLKNEEQKPFLKFA